MIDIATLHYEVDFLLNPFTTRTLSGDEFKIQLPVSHDQLAYVAEFIELHARKTGFAAMAIRLIVKELEAPRGGPLTLARLKRRLTWLNQEHLDASNHDAELGMIWAIVCALLQSAPTASAKLPTHVA